MPRRLPRTVKPPFFDAAALETFVVGRGFKREVAPRLWRVVLRALREGAADDAEVWAKAAAYAVDGRQQLSKAAITLASQNTSLFGSRTETVSESSDGDTTKHLVVAARAASRSRGRAADRPRAERTPSRAGPRGRQKNRGRRDAAQLADDRLRLVADRLRDGLPVLRTAGRAGSGVSW